MRSHRFLLTALAALLLLPLPARPQGALPMLLERGTLVDLNAALNDAFNDDLEDICRCRNVSGATRFEDLVEELETLEEAVAPERVREGLLEEGIDIPVEPGDTPRSYLERVRSTWSWTLSYEPLQDRLRDLQRDAENLERVRENRGNPYDRIQPPADVDREIEILRTLREALAGCREEEEVPPPPEERSDIREGLIIDLDLPREGPAPEPVTEARLREALLNEIRNLCCKMYDGAFGAWMGNATLGLDDAPADVQATARAYRDLLWDLATTMDTRGFHEWVDVEPGLARKRCDDEVVESIREGLLIDLEDDADDPVEVGTPRDPSAPDPAPVPSDETAGETAETEEEEVAEEPAPRDPPEGFRHVTRGSNPSRYTPESNHVAEGPDASARVRDFFEEGRDVPHVEDGAFPDRHLTAGEHASQYVDPELHVAEGPDASTLKDDAPAPPDGQRHLTRGPGATSYVPEDRHVAEGPDASGLGRGGGPEDGNEDEDDEKDEEEDEEEETEHDDSGGELARNPEDHNPDEIDDAPPARGVQRMIVEIDKVRTPVGQEGPGGWAPYRDSGGAAPDVYLVSLGTSTGRTFLVHAVGESADLGGVVVAEPVAVPARERRRIEERLRSEGASGAPTDGYCLEYERLVPPPGTLYRLVSRTVQEEHAPVRRILAAARRLMDAGALSPDTEVERYFHAIRQWAIWTREQGFDERGFAEAFVERARKNFRAAGQAWDDQVEAAVRSVVPNRWRDVQAVLSEVGE